MHRINVNNKIFLLIIFLILSIITWFVYKGFKRSSPQTIRGENRVTNSHIIADKLKIYKQFRNYRLILKIDKIFKKQGRIFFFRTNIFKTIIAKQIVIKLFKNQVLLIEAYKRSLKLNNCSLKRFIIKRPIVKYSKFNVNIEKLILNLKKNIFAIKTKDKVFKINLLD